MEQQTKCVCALTSYCERHGRTLNEKEHPRCEELLAVKQRLRTRPRRRTRKDFIGPPRPPKAGRLGGPEGPPKSPSPCGCQRRKEWLNDLSPKLKLGDKVEWVTEATGIKRIIDARNSESIDKSVQ